MLTLVVIGAVLIIVAENIVWRTVCLVHIIVVLAGIVYMSVVVVQLLLQQMNNPLVYEEGRYVTHSVR